MSWFEKHLGNDWRGVLTVIVLGTMVVLGVGIYFGVPKYQYAHANAEERCQIDLKKLHDNDKFCNVNNEIKSHKVVDEADRRAALTPKQRCEEDHKGFSDPDTGEYTNILCRDDGSFEYVTDTQLQDQMQSDILDQQSSILQDTCSPHYTPCVPNVSYDLNCADIGHRVYVKDVDVYHLDADGDGVGCESYY